MAATVRLGTCSWADEGLLKTWYPHGVSTPAARLGYYAERFDTVEVDSPFYALPDPAVTGRWAQRTPDSFGFHVKAHAPMTGHEPADQEAAFAAFRESVAPLELSGKLCAVLLHYHPRFVKSAAAKEELSRVRALLEPLVPLIEFRHRSWLEPWEQTDTLSFLQQQGLSYVSVDAPATRASNVVPRVAAATNPLAYIRFHGRNWKTWNVRSNAPGVVGNSFERVTPVTYTFPAGSTAMPLGLSSETPPRKVAQTSLEPDGSNFSTRTSLPLPLKSDAGWPAHVSNVPSVPGGLWPAQSAPAEAATYVLPSALTAISSLPTSLSVWVE